MDKNERLKQFISSENITQKEFAMKIDSTQQYVSALLNGSRKLGSNILERIEKEFDINIAWLLTGEGAMKKGVISEELQVNEEQGEYKINNNELADIKNSIQVVNENLVVLSDGIMKNFESLSSGMVQLMKNDLKIIQFIEKLDPNKINSATGKLDAFMERQEKG